MALRAQGQYISFESECSQELYEIGLISPSVSCDCLLCNGTCRQRSSFGCQIDFGVDIGRRQGDMAQPAPNRVDVDARL
jgi:hypothetical protein